MAGGSSLYQQAVQHCMHLIFQSDSIFHKAMAAQYDLEPHRIGETRIAISTARHSMVRMQTEYRMNEYSLAE